MLLLERIDFSNMLCILADGQFEVQDMPYQSLIPCGTSINIRPKNP
jgi:hypothetical protein